MKAPKKKKHSGGNQHQQAFLQRKGNDQAVQQKEPPFLSRQRLAPEIQTAPLINDDKQLEGEADKMGEQFMRKPLEEETPPPIQRQVADEELLQRKPSTSEIKNEEEENAIAPSETIAQRKPMDTGAEEPLQRQTQGITNEPDLLQKKAQADEEEIMPSDVPVQRQVMDIPPEEPLQRKAETTSSPTPTQNIKQRLQSRKGRGRPLSAGIQHHAASVFDSDFRGVSVHTDSEAAQMSQELNAQAFTHGSDIYFNRGKYDPDSAGGRRLLGHELGHVVQQAGRTTPSINRDREKQTNSFEEPICRSPEYQQQLEPIVSQENESVEVSSKIEIYQPIVQGMSFSLEPEYINLPFPVISSDKLTLSVLPIEQIFISPEQACSIGHDISTYDPKSQFPIFGEDENTEYTPFMPGFSVGQTVYTPTDSSEIVYLSPDYVVTNTMTKLAVGSANLTVLHTEAGISLIDAGVECEIGGKPKTLLAEAAIQELMRLVPGRQIMEINITHAHADHINLLPKLAEAGFQIGKIRITGLQATLPFFESTYRKMMDKYEMQIRKEVEKERVKWEKRQLTNVNLSTESLANKEAMERLWKNYLENEVSVRLNRIQPKVELLIHGSKGLEVVPADLIPVGTDRIRFKLPEGKKTSLGRIESIYKEGRTTSFLDPEAGKATTLKGKQIDTFSQNFVVELTKGNQLVVVADPRAGDFKTLAENFIKAINANGKSVTYRFIDISHHMRSGFFGGETPSEFTLANASDLRKMTAALVEIQKSSKAGSAIVVSANPELVSPANVWLFRELGLEVFVATESSQIEVLEVLGHRTGKMRTIINAEAWEGGRPSRALIADVEKALSNIQGQIDSLEQLKGLKKLESGQIEQLESLKRSYVELNDTANQYIRELVREIGKGPKDTNKSSIAPGKDELLEKARPYANRIKLILEKLGFEAKTQSVEIAGPKLTDPVLAILELKPGKGTSDTYKRVRKHYERIEALGRGIEKGGPIVEGIKLKLIAEKTSLKTVLETALTETPENGRPILEKEISRLGKGIRSLEAATRITAETVLETGAISQSVRLRIEKIPARPSKAMLYQEKAFGGIGRVLGAVMVYHSYKGQADIIEKLYNDPNFNELEALVGTLHNHLGTTVGIRMVMPRMRVHPGEIVVMAILDFTQTLVRDYESTERRNIDITYSAIRNSINTALFLVGSQLMEKGGFWTKGLGFIIMFLGDYILEFLQVYNLLEEWLSFEPAEVVDVRQKLKDLMEQYSIVYGAIRLRNRELIELRDLGSYDPVGLKEAAEKAIRSHLEEARELEVDILEEFEEGYEEARTRYSGLLALDQMKRYFLSLRDEVHKDPVSSPNLFLLQQLSQTFPFLNYVPATWFDPNRIQIAKRFRQIDKDLDISDLSSEAIKEMDLWDEIDDQLDTVQTEFEDLSENFSARIEKFSDSFEPIAWKDLQEELDKARRMLENARYRLRPELSGTFRSVGMIRPGSRAYQPYISELIYREVKYRKLLSQVSYLTMPSATTEPERVENFQDIIHIIRIRRQRYEKLLLKIDKSIGKQAWAKILQKSISFSMLYQRFLAKKGVEDLLHQLDIAEFSLNEAIENAKFLFLTFPSDVSQDILPVLENEIEITLNLINNRRTHFNIILPGEQRETEIKIQRKEERHLVQIFKGLSQEKALTEEEKLALSSEELEDPANQLSSMWSQLYELHKIQDEKQLPRKLELVRLRGKDRLTGTKHYSPNNAIFAIAYTGKTSGFSGHDYRIDNIIPITKEAIDYLRGNGICGFSHDAIQTVALDEVKPDPDNPQLPKVIEGALLDFDMGFGF